MPAFPNPELHQLYQRDLGTLWEAARAAGVKPGTIRVWETRGKISRIDFGDSRSEAYYHLPTVKLAAEAGGKYAPPNPASNSHGSVAA